MLNTYRIAGLLMTLFFFGGRIKVHWKDAKGNLIKTIEGNEGDDLLSLAHEHDIDLEGQSHFASLLPGTTRQTPSFAIPGACEGSVACSTCHVILTPEHYELVPEPEVSQRPSPPPAPSPFRSAHSQPGRVFVCFSFFFF